MKNLTESEKVRRLYNMIGERGLYVNTNFDIFEERPEMVNAGVAYKVPLLKPGTRAYNSGLLFSALTALLNHGTILITGAPGIGKTSAAELIGHFFHGVSIDDILEAEILGHPQLTEEKMIARYDIARLMNSENVVIPTKFMRCPVKIIDEVNRIPTDTASVAMKLADIGKAVYGGELLVGEPGPLIVTANYADEGTFQLTPPFLDRYDVAVMMSSPPQWDLREIRERGDEKLNGNLEELLIIPDELKLDLGRIRKEIHEIPEERDEYGNDLATGFADFVYASLRFSEAASDALARATKGNAWLRNQDRASGGHFTDSSFVYTVNEMSVRSVRAIPRYAKAFAWFRGRDKVNANDVKLLLPYFLWHKINPSRKALTENPKWENDRISFVEALVGKIESEFQEMQSSEAYSCYSAAINALVTGKVNEKELSDDEIRTLMRSAITRIGKTDRPYSLMLAQHVATEYNLKYARSDGEER